MTEEDEDHHYHERNCEQQLELNIADRRANGNGSVGQDRNLYRGRQGGIELRQQLHDAVDYVDDVRARLTLHIHNHRRTLVHPGGLLHVFDTIDDIGDILHTDRRAVVISDDDRLVVGAGVNLVVGADAE